MNLLPQFYELLREADNASYRVDHFDPKTAGDQVLLKDMISAEREACLALVNFCSDNIAKLLKELENKGV